VVLELTTLLALPPGLLELALRAGYGESQPLYQYSQQGLMNQHEQERDQREKRAQQSGASREPGVVALVPIWCYCASQGGGHV